MESAASAAVESATTGAPAAEVATAAALEAPGLPAFELLPAAARAEPVVRAAALRERLPARLAALQFLT